MLTRMTIARMYGRAFHQRVTMFLKVCANLRQYTWLWLRPHRLFHAYVHCQWYLLSSTSTSTIKSQPTIWSVTRRINATQRVDPNLIGLVTAAAQPRSPPLLNWVKNNGVKPVAVKSRPFVTLVNSQSKGHTLKEWTELTTHWIALKRHYAKRSSKFSQLGEYNAKNAFETLLPLACD